jgi:hypothetical protein
MRHDIDWQAADDFSLRFRQRSPIRASTRRRIRQLDAIIFPTAHLADFVRAVAVGRYRKTAGWTSHVFCGSTKLNIQGAASRTVDQESISNLPVAPMTVPKGAHHVSGYPLRLGQAATGGLAQGFDEFDAASRKYEGKTLLIASRWQNHTKAPFTTETGRRSLVNVFDGKQSVSSG